MYLKDEAALEKFKVEHKGQKFQVNRLKGLGEMSDTETTILVDPNKRILKQITVEDVKATNVLFDQLMGTATSPRKEYIKLHSKEATYQS